MKYILISFVSIIATTILYSCHHTHLVTTKPTYGGSEMLYQYKWNLTELNSQPVAIDKDTAHLIFYAGQVNKVSGSTGCNRLNGTFELSEEHKIKFSPLSTTRMACPSQEESKLLTALGQVDNWSIINNQLLLNNGKILLAKLLGVSAGPSK